MKAEDIDALVKTLQQCTQTIEHVIKGSELSGSHKILLNKTIEVQDAVIDNLLTHINN